MGNDLQRRAKTQAHRLKQRREESNVATTGVALDQVANNACVDCGWGRLVFANTFESPQLLADTLRAEGPDRRDVAFYVLDPHVALAQAPNELFLDPSHTYRLNLSTYRASKSKPKAFFIRRSATVADAEAINAIYAARNMVAIPPAFFWSHRDDRVMIVLVAEDAETGDILGTVMGVDHKRAYYDPEGGTSLWCLAVAPQAPHAGIGETLVRRLAELFAARGASYMDLSVMHDNEQAIALYEKMGFRRAPVFALKRKNVINEKLYTGSGEQDAEFNPYARLIIDEARRRGISVEPIDAEGGFFRLAYGGRSVTCCESLSEVTSAVAMSICDDKRVTRRVVENAGVIVPDQLTQHDADARAEFLAKHGKVVVKPARGEQGRGIAVGLTQASDIETAVESAREVCPDVVVESCFDGEDLRLIVIDYRVVAAAVRRPARIVGDGKSTIEKLISAQSRRRSAATGGESTIPLDAETDRCLAAAGHTRDDVLGTGIELAVRKTANLHTGGTIHDVTGETHPALIEAAVKAARAIEIPVTGIDLMVTSPREADYIFIEANERPGLANHEPQPTAERFVDLLFPLTIPRTLKEFQRTTTS
ncbi:MAG: N-acetylglutaminylglutamine synthetase [Pseudomonadota bacterium]